jgi:uncharacterized protein YndB with AHSA1/START domain
VAGDGVIERELRIDAPRELVFALLTESGLMQSWQALEAETDPRPGGIYRAKLKALDMVILGKFVEVDVPKRVVYTFGWEGSPEFVPAGSTTVEINLSTDGDATILRLRHSGFSEGEAESHEPGWDHYLRRLATVGAGRNPGPDVWAG